MSVSPWHLLSASNCTALANAEVEIAYDPMNTETIKVVYQDMKPIMAHRVSIGAFCDKTVDVPVGMTDKIPETSRFLDAMEKKYKEDHVSHGFYYTKTSKVK